MKKQSDTFWMMRCLRLAANGRGHVSPNPLVGAVIVKNGKKIAEGYHQRYGGHHAEVIAIQKALEKKADIHDATIYVNLEPCFHYGKTPPCVDSIVRYGFSRVVIATTDPNPFVSGKSIKKLQRYGIDVTIGTLRKQSEKLNEKFFKFIQTPYPFVALKAAQTRDGFIAKEDGSSRWITNSRSREIVHQLRNEYDAVLVGASTVIHDDPLLTVRSVKGRNPVRVIVDGRFTTPVSSAIFNSDSKTIVYISERAAKIERKKLIFLRKKGIVIVKAKDRHGVLNIKQILRDLHSRHIASVLIEGGQKTFTEFLNARVVDKLYLFTAMKKFGKGLKTFGDISVSYKKKVILSSVVGTDKYQECSIEY